LENSPQYLFLASGVNNGEGFWIVGIKNCDDNILEDENLLDCHRKELIGTESAKDILLAINLNVNNLLNELCIDSKVIKNIHQIMYDHLVFLLNNINPLSKDKYIFLLNDNWLALYNKTIADLYDQKNNNLTNRRFKKPAT